jgi:two-component system OmpR family response regulator
MRILVIEDDEETAGYIAKGLRQSGYFVDVAADGSDGLFQAVREAYDLAIVDRMLPALDGLSVVQALRSAGKRTPVLFLSAMAEVRDRVDGLRGGGDDYLTKPFAFSELLARVEALLRRPAGRSTETVLRVADLELDLRSHRVKRGGRPIDLQPREFKLLHYLMEHAGQVVTRTMMLEQVWDCHFDLQTNVIDVHISRLRQKIDKDFDPPLLHTVRGTGYSLRAPS